MRLSKADYKAHTGDGSLCEPFLEGQIQQGVRLRPITEKRCFTGEKGLMYSYSLKIRYADEMTYTLEMGIGSKIRDEESWPTLMKRA